MLFNIWEKEIKNRENKWKLLGNGNINSNFIKKEITHFYNFFEKNLKTRKKGFEKKESSQNFSFCFLKLKIF